MFGILSIQEHFAYNLQVASDPDDALANVVQKTPAPGSEVVGGSVCTARLRPSPRYAPCTRSVWTRSAS
mgnify:CR=1 FL=1